MNFLSRIFGMGMNRSHRTGGYGFGGSRRRMGMIGLVAPILWSNRHRIRGFGQSLAGRFGRSGGTSVRGGSVGNSSSEVSNESSRSRAA